MVRIFMNQMLEDVDPGLVDHRANSSMYMFTIYIVWTMTYIHPNSVEDHSKKHTGWTVNDVDFLRRLPCSFLEKPLNG